MSFGQWKPTITLKYQPFPKQACIHKIINDPIDSNPQDDIYNLGEHPCQKASLCSFFKGSYTLEAAVIIPVAAVFFLTLLFFFRVLQIQTEVQEALNYASRKTACEASAVSSQTGLLVSAEAYFRKPHGCMGDPHGDRIIFPVWCGGNILLLYELENGSEPVNYFAVCVFYHLSVQKQGGTDACETA